MHFWAWSYCSLYEADCFLFFGLLYWILCLCLCAQCTLRGLPSDDAMQQLLIRHCTQQATHEDTARLERLKTLLQLLISYEGSQLGAVPMVERQSQPSVVAAAIAARRGVDLRRYKTELCRSYAETGHCRYGVKCQFAHGVDELRPLARHPRYRTELCHSFHVNGFCPYGSRCNFIHSDTSLPSAVAEACSSNRPCKLASVLQPSEVPVCSQNSPVSCLMLKQYLRLADDVKERAICGRSSDTGMMQAAVPSQAATRMNSVQDR